MNNPPALTVNGMTPGNRLGHTVGIGILESSDSREELVISAPGTDTANGAGSGVTLVLPGTDTLPPGFMLMDDAPMFGRLLGSGPGSGMAAAVATGDVPADGIPDLLVSAVEGTGIGVVYLVQGIGLAIAGATIDVNDIVSNSPPGGGSIGTRLAIGDINGDGFADAIASAPLALAPDGKAPGSVVATFGAPTLPAGLTTSLEVTGLDDDDRFGISLSIGDLTDDAVPRWWWAPTRATVRETAAPTPARW